MVMSFTFCPLVGHKERKMKWIQRGVEYCTIVQLVQKNCRIGFRHVHGYRLARIFICELDEQTADVCRALLNSRVKSNFINLRKIKQVAKKAFTYIHTT